MYLYTHFATVFINKNKQIVRIYNWRNLCCISHFPYTLDLLPLPVTVYNPLPSDPLSVSVHTVISISIYLSLNKVTIIWKGADMSTVHWLQHMLKADYVLPFFHSVQSPIRYSKETRVRPKEKVRKDVLMILANVFTSHREGHWKSKASDICGQLRTEFHSYYFRLLSFCFWVPCNCMTSVMTRVQPWDQETELAKINIILINYLINVKLFLKWAQIQHVQLLVTTTIQGNWNFLCRTATTLEHYLWNMFHIFSFLEQK